MLLPLAAGDGNGYKGECPPSFQCGYVGNISFPFTKIERQDCGLLAIHNCDDHPMKPKEIQLVNQGKWFEVIRVVEQVPRSPTVTNFQVRDKYLYQLLQSRNCEAFTYNCTLPPTFHFGAFRIGTKATLFRCNQTLHVRPPIYMFNYTKCHDYDLYYGPEITANYALTACAKVQLPIKDVPDSYDPFTFVNADINVEVKLTDECANCHHLQRGQCQLDNGGRFFCANSYENIIKKMPVVATVSLVTAGVAVLMVSACCFRTKIFSPPYLLFWKANPTHKIIEEFLKEHGPLPTARYSYSEVKKITNSFRNKLGQGGYGCVYKGKLHDGRVVAVKILSKSKGNGEEFINEVASISKTSHVNIVTLLGFCLDGSERALIYEFMPNGSLEKFIYEDKNPLQVARQLDCKTLYDIAIGVARGLEYLHRGCNTRILHFDIKPHNILLDENFSPKISDFGLAKICTREESIVSIFGVRGTAGYIDPEVFSRNFGAVSHKSDVYSYGMMVLEMVGRRKNINDQVDRSSEIYFPHWIYNRLESNQELGLRNIRNESDDEKMRKMTIVGLWCIETDPSTRPAISKVIEMLEGSIELLQVPPKPFLSSPSTSPVHLSCETL
ncbi:LEAF RUST 10 DISEASE-RESISTANCE LOCUS RECEPTOR-LIKE PROTEIN KINASE-like 2.4 isoform X1 [Gastrolobium bilobum]|uniref:LEAF RUST 10 DISEASE-RESISTANCE LOCUS RECEPTOR-LIKE PROTEIN KINASE-like 2.4 isoform X1 n=2 Tax=Gastrolobium bilobum TaxID=150636 RepID=UPI002AB105B3|nr:LEAF RUST 10 DISEASE-RESISTANCE LOCUS RECEPTOR-LIKE PROTEIN KINASE-like 2.4 isoform X1 [Gastrolobium bilobum]